MGVPVVGETGNRSEETPRPTGTKVHVNHWPNTHSEDERSLIFNGRRRTLGLFKRKVSQKPWPKESLSTKIHPFLLIPNFYRGKTPVKNKAKVEKFREKSQGESL